MASFSELVRALNATDERPAPKIEFRSWFCGDKLQSVSCIRIDMKTKIDGDKIEYGPMLFKNKFYGGKGLAGAVGALHYFLAGYCNEIVADDDWRAVFRCDDPRCEQQVAGVQFDAGGLTLFWLND